VRAPKHIRERKTERKAEALRSYDTARANGTLERSGHTAKGIDCGGRPVNNGFRSSPNLLLGYRFHQPMNAKGSIGKRGIHSYYETISGTDSEGKVHKAKRRRDTKSVISDADLYGAESYTDEHLNRKLPLETGEVKIRVGTTPSRLVPIKDKVTGEEHLVRVRAKAKWQDVGLPSVTPKDGGKDG
jgi:hypothetical protein